MALLLTLLYMFSAPVSAAQEIFFKDGPSIKGDLIAEYDHDKWWWSKERKVSYAILQELPVASIKIVDKSNIDFNKTKCLNLKTNLLGQYLKIKGLDLKRSPLDVPIYVATADDGHHKHEDGFGDYALDLIVLGSDKWSYKNGGKVNEDFYIWDKEVYAPISGTVFEVLKSEVDKDAVLNYSDDVTPDFSESNRIGIYLEDNLYFYMLHFKQDTISDNINIGDEIKVGDYIGRVGNSGVTYVPHLHTTLFFWDIDTARFWSIPINFNSIFRKKISETMWSQETDYFPERGDELK